MRRTAPPCCRGRRARGSLPLADQQPARRPGTCVLRRPQHFPSASGASGGAQYAPQPVRERAAPAPGLVPLPDHPTTTEPVINGCILQKYASSSPCSSDVYSKEPPESKTSEARGPPGNPEVTVWSAEPSFTQRTIVPGATRPPTAPTTDRLSSPRSPVPLRSSAPPPPPSPLGP